MWWMAKCRHEWSHLESSRPGQVTPANSMRNINEPFLLRGDLPKWPTHRIMSHKKMLWTTKFSSDLLHSNNSLKQVFVWVLAQPKVMKLLLIRSRSKLSCQKWHLRAPYLISCQTSQQALKQLPTHVLGSTAGSQMLLLGTLALPSWHVTSLTFKKEWRVEVEREEEIAPMLSHFRFQWQLFLALIFLFSYLYWPREKAMAPHSSTLAWKIPRMEEPGRLQSMGSRRVRHDWATSLFTDHLWCTSPVTWITFFFHLFLLVGG